MVGAPGSKWSAVARSIYFSPDIDHSDYRRHEAYSHGQSGVNHIGAYFDPGMIYGQFFDRIEQSSPSECEVEFNRPFVGSCDHPRIIKSHVLSTKLPYLREHWPTCPIILVLRDDHACLDWWLGAGGFAITYPSYRWYQDADLMLRRIREQNSGIRDFLTRHKTTLADDSSTLATVLGIAPAALEFQRNFARDDTQVHVFLP